MSPHQTAEQITAQLRQLDVSDAWREIITDDITTALQAASNEEMSRRREYIASLEAALREAKRMLLGAAPTVAEHAVFYGNEPLEDAMIEFATKPCSTSALDAVVAEVKEQHGEAEFKRGWRCALGDVAATLGMGAIEAHHKGELWVEKLYARDARLVAEAVAKVTEERDALAAALEKRNIALNQIWSRLGGWAEAFPSAEAFQECKSVINDCRDGLAPKAILADRDSRVKAEGAAAELDRFATMESEKPMCEESSRHVTEYKMRAHCLRKLAAQAGEATNGD